MARSASFSAPKLFSLVELDIPQRQPLKTHRRCCLQNVEEILIRIKSVFLCSFNHADDDRAALCTAGRIGKQDVLPVNDKWFNASLCAGVADFQPAIFKIRSQIWPLLQQIVERFTECRLRYGIPALRPAQKGVQNRFCLLLPLAISFFRTALLQLVFNGKQLIAIHPPFVNCEEFRCDAGNALSASSKYLRACTQQPTPLMFSGRIW